MAMTKAQARELGRVLVRARARKGLSIRAVARQIDVAPAWVLRLEAGSTPSPALALLSRLGEALDIDPARLDKLTRGAVSADLPTPRVYFRSKLALTPQETERVMKYIERMRRAA